MGKIAVLLSGQGAQHVGMGKELADASVLARQVFQQADECLGFSLSELCFSGPEIELNRTFNTQPAILTVSIAAWRELEHRGLKADVFAGLSLGEYSAHVAAGSLDLSDAVQIVRQRGQFMQEAVPEGVGAMAAIMGLGSEQVVAACAAAESAGDGLVRAANFNCPGQIVISGNRDAVQRAVDEAKARGASRAVMLPVSAPFHCPLMEPAQIKLQAVLDRANIGKAGTPVVSNVTAKPVTEPDQIRQMLIEQVTSTVRWEQSIQYMIDQGVTLFIEVGPGAVLTGFMRRIDKSLAAVSVSDMSGIETALAMAEEVC